MKNILFYSIFLLSASTLFSQQATIWTFGVGARLDFSNGTNPPVAGTSSISSYEGSATMSDNAGNLLFYTDGSTVFGPTNAVIQTGLMGNWSSAQCGIIVPEPGVTPNSTTGRYFIFSVPAFASERVRYSILDYTSGSANISLSNLNLVMPDHAVAQNTCEGITVARHCNGIDYWVITHEFGNNKFKAYQVTNAGILSPVSTNIGPVASLGSNNINSAACMKISPNNRKLAFCVRQSSVNLFDFNPSSGIVSNLNQVTTGTNRAYYGLEFSPNSAILYYTDILTNLYKYNIASSVNQSMGNIASPNGDDLYGALQLAPNGIIYMGRDGNSNLSILNQPFLGVISNPNNFNTSSFNANGISLLPGTASKVGLPNVIPSITAPAITSSNDTIICSGDSAILSISGGVSYNWSPPNGLSSINTSNVIASPPSTQTYSITITDGNGCVFGETVTVYIDTTCCITPVYSSNNLTVCQNELIVYPDGFTEIASSNTNHISNLLTIGGCDSLVTTWVTVTPIDEINITEVICLGSDFTYPDGFVSTNVTVNESHNSLFTNSAGCDSIVIVQLQVINGYSTTIQETVCAGDDYVFPDGTTAFDINASTVYQSNLFSSNGCDSTINTYVTVLLIPEPDLGPDIQKCADEIISLTNNVGNSYIWNTGETTSSIFVETEGYFSIEVSNACGSNSDTIQITNVNCDCHFYVPNSFTPDKDEFNRYFYPKFDCKLIDFEMEIYDRWGERILLSLDPNYEWDGTFNGKIVSQGIYVYKIRYTNQMNEERQLVGHVNVLY